MKETPDFDRLRSWIGARRSVSETIVAKPLNLAAATIPPGDASEDVLPPLRHWLYFLSAAPLDSLGRDGHPERGGFLPPVALPRRMWAGGRLEFLAPVRIGDAAERNEEVVDIQLKDSRVGPICVVTTRTEIRVGGALRLREERDLVYREAPKPSEPPPASTPPPERAELRRTIAPTSTLLFRYSALTFNGHRIHYDKDYCRNVEGYPDLVVHGPLIATLLCDLAVELAVADRPAAQIRAFSYRARRPLFANAPFEIAAKQTVGGVEAWAVAPDGAAAMTSEASFG